MRRAFKQLMSGVYLGRGFPSVINKKAGKILGGA
jgi:hypothetical protein